MPTAGLMEEEEEVVVVVASEEESELELEVVTSIVAVGTPVLINSAMVSSTSLVQQKLAQGQHTPALHGEPAQRARM